MESIRINTVGARVSQINSNSPKLKITWAKAFNEIYCHHASLYIPFISDSLFSPELVKITVHVRENIIEKGGITGFVAKSISRFFPIMYENNYIKIDLKTPEILDSLCENGWTRLKSGERGLPKSFPLSIESSIDGKEPAIFDFKYELGLYPFTICENFLNDLQESQKIQFEIELD